MPDLAALEQALGVSFRDARALQRALVHASYVNEHPDLDQEANERLEFLGDAVLGCAVAEELYRRHVRLPEGELTVLRSALVNRARLAQVARDLRLGEYLVLGTGEERSGGRERESILAAALEALLGALFLDRGYRVCRRVVRGLLREELHTAPRPGLARDPKSQLQQTLQTQRKLSPQYRTVHEAGPGHRRQFTVEVLAGDEVLGVGEGLRKGLAERAAAAEALRRLGDSQGS